MAKVIDAFHDNIKCGPEYVCTCCDQLWYRSSARKCEANKYPKCSEALLKACITTTTSIDNTKWICFTSHSNLSNGKLLYLTVLKQTKWERYPNDTWPSGVFNSVVYFLYNTLSTICHSVSYIDICC